MSCTSFASGFHCYSITAGPQVRACPITVLFTLCSALCRRIGGKTDKVFDKVADKVSENGVSGQTRVRPNVLFASAVLLCLMAGPVLAQRPLGIDVSDY